MSQSDNLANSNVPPSEPPLVPLNSSGLPRPLTDAEHRVLIQRKARRLRDRMAELQMSLAAWNQAHPETPEELEEDEMGDLEET